MPRRKSPRKIVAPPVFKGYKPYGCSKVCDGEVELLYEEYEALKLADYDLMSHHEACNLMGISRATFARIYESARRKIAKAFVEARVIKAVYGNVYFDGHWFKCGICRTAFTLPGPSIDRICPVCRSDDIEKIDSNELINNK